MSILITRPEPGASRTLAALAAHGLTGVSAPLFNVVLTDAPRPTGKFAALIVTSANGAAGLVPALADLAADIPVFAVGDRTADAMRLAGFTQVASASGDNRALSKLVAASIAPRYRLLLASGEDHKDALPAALTRTGYEIALWTRYKAVSLDELPAVARVGLQDGSITSVLHYSRRAADTFVALAMAAGLARKLPALTHYVLSQDVGEPLIAAGCTDIRIAASPTDDQLLALLVPQQGGATSDLVLPNLALPNLALPNLALPAPAPEGNGRPKAMLANVKQVSEPMAIPPDSASSDHPAGQISQRAVPRSRKVAASPMSGPSLRAVDVTISTSAPDPAPEILSGPDTEFAHEPAGRAPVSAPVTLHKGVGWAGLAALSLVSGLIGAAAITFFAPVLNTAGIRLPNSPTLAAVDTRLSRLETARPSAVSGVTADPALQASISAAATQAAELRGQVEAMNARISELAARPAQVNAAASLPGAGSPALADLQQQVEQSGKRAGEALAAAQALAPRLADMERDKRAASTPSLAATGAARLIMADRIARAMADGRSFAPEAAALAAMGTTPDPLRALTAAAQAGVPTWPALRTALAPVRQQVVSSPPADASWSDRFLSLMGSLVRVRSTGAGQGQSPLAIISRIDQSLQNGDAGAAVALFGQLPEPARRVGAGWLEAATRRTSADTALKTITDDAVRAMSGTQ